MKKVFPIFTIIAGIYWIIEGFSYGVWIRKGPGGGFMPILGGVLAIIFTIIYLITNRKDDSPSGFTIKAFLPVVALITLVLCSFVVGVIISIAIFVFVWLWKIEKYKISSSVITGIVCSSILYGIFVAWLRVPLPKGILGIF